MSNFYQLFKKWSTQCTVNFLNLTGSEWIYLEVISIKREKKEKKLMHLFVKIPVQRFIFE